MQENYSRLGYASENGLQVSFVENFAISTKGQNQAYVVSCLYTTRRPAGYKLDTKDYMNTQQYGFTADIKHREEISLEPSPLFTTERIELVNSNSRKIVAYLDSPAADAAPSGIVLIAPGYGETKENNLLVSAYLAANGLRGIRFDWTDHVGESEGDIASCTLSKMQRDLFDIYNYVRHEYSCNNVGVFATSLAARVALKVAAQSEIAFLVCVNPVINLRQTLKMVYREDLVENHRGGRRYGALDILGFSVDADNFLHDSVSRAFADRFSSELDASRIVGPALFFVGERDGWVQMSDVQRVFNRLQTTNRQFVILPTVLHRLLENPSAATKALDVIVTILNRTFRYEAREIAYPDQSQLEIRGAAEKAHLRQVHHYSRTEEREFWKTYLSNFEYITRIHDYYALLECIYERLGGAVAGQRVLDAGCGIGNYGLFLLTKRLYYAQRDLRISRSEPLSYFGLDAVPDALRQARAKLSQLGDEFKARRASAHGNVLKSAFVVSDLETGIPFQSDFFDQICCNLVISYVGQPDDMLRELWRVLKRNGKVVVSSLKPNADLSEVYRHFISVSNSPAEIEEGRKLLSNAGMIKLKEAVGIYHFYSEKELKNAIRKAGFFRVKSFRSFGNQANVVVGSKMN